MNKQTKTMENCEGLAEQIAKDFKGITKEMQATNLMDRVVKELPFINDFMSLGVLASIDKREPNTVLITNLKEAIRDGYEGLSIQLTKDISNF